MITNRSARSGTGGTVYLLAGEDFGKVTGNLREWPDALSRDEVGGGARRELDLPAGSGAAPRRIRVRTFSLREDFGYFARDGDRFLLVGRGVEELSALRAQMKTTFLWGLATTLLIGASCGFWFSRRLTARIAAINAASRTVMAGDLSARVPTGRRGDDIDELGDHFNRMLEKIEDLMAGVRELSDNIAHDLRTPLARLRNELETARAESADAREPLDRALEEADGLLDTFSALLRIARIEAGERRAGFGKVDLAALVADVAEFYEPLAEERRQELTIPQHDSVWIRGDRNLLFQAVANLIDNAIKYTPMGGTIAIGLDVDGDHATVSVSDSGPGIEAEDRARVLERFFRVEASRSQPGNGLGLSLVAAVAKLHSAELRLGDGNPGLLVSLRIPLWNGA